MVKIGTREEYYVRRGKKHIFTKDDCPFCKPEEQKENVVWKGKYWYMLHNMFPYSGDEGHLMAVPYKHRQFSTELSIEEFAEMKEVQDFVKEFFKDKSKDYFSCTRETMGNRSVEHMHMHFVSGKLQGKYLRKMLQNQGFPIIQELDCSNFDYKSF